MRSDLFLFFGILILLFVLWVATGGPSRPLSFAGPYITPITMPGGSATGYSLQSGGSAAADTTRTNAQVQQGVNQASQDLVDLQKSLAESKHFGTPSVFKDQVSISFSGPSRTTDPEQEYLSLYVSGRSTTGIDISGWRIESEANNHSFRIPEGVNLPRSAIVNQTAPIVLMPGQSAIITMGQSPVGMSFRENECTGYFGQFQNFTPSLVNYCPDPRSDFDRFYIGNQHNYDACRAYVSNVYRCTVPLDSPSGLSTDCWHFINTNLNYSGCVTAHLTDATFFNNSWRIYLGNDKVFFTKMHDTVKLLDSSGNTVDLVSY